MGKNDKGTHHAEHVTKPANTEREHRKQRTVRVDDPWPGEIEVEVTREKVRTISRLGLLFGGLLVILAAYAIWRGNDNMLEEILGMVEGGLLYVAAWAVGPAALRLLSKVRIGK